MKVKSKSGDSQGKNRIQMNMEGRSGTFQGDQLKKDVARRRMAHKACRMFNDTLRSSIRTVGGFEGMYYLHLEAYAEELKLNR